MNTNKHLIISGILFSVVLFIWPVFMAAFQPPENIDHHFEWISTHLAVYRLQFFFAFLISPSILYLMFSQLEKHPAENRIVSAIGTLFMTGYLILNSISYASQMIILPKLIEADMIAQAKIWYFSSSVSVMYFFNQTGYCFWGVGSVILFGRLIKQRGIIRYISIIYTVSAVLSIIAFTGLILDNKAINSLTLYSGLILVPVGILTIIWGVKENRRN